MDTLTSKLRSERMRLVRSRDTKPEMIVRSLVHSLGYRYRLHQGNLPGRPDLVFPSRRKIIFVHGCFWHRHHGCRNNRLPKSRLEFWRPKLDANRVRDRRNRSKLRRLGWDVMVVWECQLKETDRMVTPDGRKTKRRSTRRIPEHGVVTKRNVRKSQQRTDAIGTTQREVMRGLVRECKIMESRVRALLDFALDGLTAYDVFGTHYEKLLKADVRSLRRAVVMGERHLGEVVDVTDTVDA